MRVGYKQTEVGVIPEDWLCASLENMSAFITKGSTPTTYGYQWEQSGVLFLRSECVSERGLDLTQSMFISPAAHASLKRSEVCDGDILVTITGYVGRVVYLVNVGQANLNQHIARVRIISSKVDRRYAFFFLSQPSVRRYFNTITTGQAYPQISLKQVRETVIPFPPTKAEQAAIAKALSDADALIEALEQLIAKKRQIKQGAMQELLTGKKRLPGFGGEWVETIFGAIAERIVGGGTPSRSVASYWNGDIPWMTVKDFAHQSRVGTIEYITKEGLKNSASNLIPKNTLIIATRMALGKAVIFEVDVSINQDLKAVFPTKDTDPLFLYYWVQFNEDPIAEVGSGSTVMGLSLGELKKIPFLKPSHSEQTAIATILSDMDTELVTLETQLAKARQLKQGMMQELLTGRIRLL